MSRAVLVVEDDPLMRSFLTEVLAAEGLRVESAVDGRGGLPQCCPRHAQRSRW